MEKIITNGYGGKKKPEGLYHNKSSFRYTENFITGGIALTLKSKLLALGIFLYFFIENGTLGVLPQSYYVIYRNVRISDFILYILVGYSLVCIREYSDLFKSKSFLLVKLFLFYLILEFIISAIDYKFSVIEYFFRLKGVWSSFLIFPFFLLLKRDGLPFLIKLIFPISLISNFLYILTALTGKPFLPDVTIILQRLPGDMEVFRVFGGTFYGELFFIYYIYRWVNVKFRLYQLFLAIFFMIPHILAFGRSAWASFLFSIAVIIVMNILRKRNFKVVFRQGLILCVFGVVLAVAFIKLIPESDYYLDALSSRLLQGKDDVTYTEGTYATRVDYQTSALLYLWYNNNWLIGIGMHPMWVYRAETLEENRYYGAFCDVAWPGVLAAYGLIGLGLAVIIQFKFIVSTYKLMKKVKVVNIFTFFLTILFARLIFDTFLAFSYIFISISLWGLFLSLNFYFAVFILLYEKYKDVPEVRTIREPNAIKYKYSEYKLKQ